MKHVTAAVVLVSAVLLSLAPVVQAKESIQWLKGSKNLATAQKKAGDENKLLLLDFFHPD
jgi:hypothetical protein